MWPFYVLQPILRTWSSAFCLSNDDMGCRGVVCLLQHMAPFKRHEACWAWICQMIPMWLWPDMSYFCICTICKTCPPWTHCWEDPCSTVAIGYYPCHLSDIATGFCVVQGFLSEGLDQFAQDVVYKTFSPTVGLFLACSAGYGLWKVSTAVYFHLCINTHINCMSILEIALVSGHKWGVIYVH